MRNSARRQSAVLFSTAVVSASVLAADKTAAARPNILIILSDDSGYTDPGCYGGEIDTPNIDRLGANGLRFRNFYTNGRCSPTRASILTGRDSACAGFGAGTLGSWKLEIKDSAYRARLPYELPTLAEVMKGSGYHTMMVGKWHLGGSLMKNDPALQQKWKEDHPGWEFTQDEINADFNALPAQRGFDEFFGLVEGETDFFFTPQDPHEYLEGNEPAQLSFDQTYTMHCYIDPGARSARSYTSNHGKTVPAFYDTDGITDRAIKMIKHASGDSQPPFFLYMAYRAPHKPLQAPQELVDKYLLRYQDLGKVETDRMQGLIREKLMPAGTEYRQQFATGRTFPPEQDADYKHRLAIHAAMLEKVDENVGRVVQTLEELGQLNNTLIIYLSDNGAASHVAEMMNKPYYGCKSILWEGGLKTHCLAHWPGVIKPGTITGTVGWVGDLLPTCLALAGGTYPAEFRGTKTVPPDGRNILPVLKGEEMPPPEYRFFNDKGFQAVICQGRWKLLIVPDEYASRNESWKRFVKSGNYRITLENPGVEYELYDLKNDPAETKNLAKDHPERVKQLTDACDAWQKRCGIMDYNEMLKKQPKLKRL
jgi:arylsulfatase